MFCSTVRVTVLLPSALGGRPVTNTSTFMPGSTKPATPTTSLTRTETARMPIGIWATGPTPAPRAANRPSRIGSSKRILLITGRSITSSGLLKAPLGKAPAGTFVTLISSGLTVTPMGSGLAATTTSCKSTCSGFLAVLPALAEIW